MQAEQHLAGCRWEAGAAARCVRTRTRAEHSLGVTDRAAACLGAMIGKKQSGGLAGSSGMAAFVIMERKYRLRYFRNINKSTLRSACHAWQACVQRNRRFRFAHFCPRCFLYHPRVPQAAPACLRSFAPKSFLPCPERFSASSAIPTRVLPADPARTQRCSSCV